jgi:H+/Na+-translocating ferredoxin:NAD+ oxidoreductase subunit B
LTAPAPAPAPAAAAGTAVARLAALIDAALPQTQCTRCGEPDCAAYALAVAEGRAGIDQCPPGGTEGVRRLAQLTGRPLLPLNPAHGLEGPRTLAVIDEAWCIGCTLCLDACPTDAIIGANKRMHTVMAPHCTGCELCIPVCPVDCIQLVNASGSRTGWSGWSAGQATHARERYKARKSRLQRDDVVSSTATASAQGTVPTTNEEAQAGPADAAQSRQAAIAAALARARERRSPPTGR